MKHRNHFKSAVLSIAVIAAILLFLTGCTKNDGNSKMPENQQAQTVQKDTTIIRDKSVNVQSLDADKDGSLYQCEMDYDVISDKPGTCPKCGMDLKKVPVADAKKNFDSFNNN